MPYNVVCNQHMHVRYGVLAMQTFSIMWEFSIYWCFCIVFSENMRESSSSSNIDKQSVADFVLELQTLRQIHRKLSEQMYLVNKIFQTGLLAIILSCFVKVLFQAYFVATICLHINPTFIQLLTGVANVVFYMGRVTMICLVSRIATDEVI